MKKENVYPYTDLLGYADENNLCSWNKAIDLLEEEGYIPFYECRTRKIWPTDGENKSSENETLRKIIDGFCEQEGINFITIIDD
jgi:hypothetical protein